MAVLTLADIAVSQSLRVGGDTMDDAIINHMRRTYNLMIGQPTAEKIKIDIGSVAELPEERSREVRGRDLISGLPRKCMITSQEIREALKEPIGQILECVLRTLEQLEPELAADLVESGITMVGGGALLPGLDEVMTVATGLEARVCDDAMTCVARGTAIYLDNLTLLKDAMESDLGEM